MHYLLKIKLESFILFTVLILAAFLRFYNLGYSDYQGDEIKALFNTKDDKNFFEFLFDQKKGPGQFTVTKILKEVSNNYLNYLVVRLPFAIAGFLAVIIFYLVTRNFFNSNVAIYSTIFFGSCGFLVAFSRIVQYQSFVIMFGLLAILLGQYFVQTKKIHFLIFATLSLAFSILFHYDGIFFGICLGLIILKEIYELKEKKKIIYSALFSFVLLFGILACFYIPFVLNIKSSTLDYFQERIEGVGGNTKISSSIFNFNVYQPYFSLYVYIFFSCLGLFQLIKNYKNLKFIIIFLWALVPFIFMEVLIKSPGTHIYTYLIPAMILIGAGVDFSLNLLKIKVLKNTLIMVFGLITLHLFLQSYILFVDHKIEYPWQDKKILYFDLKAITQNENKKYYLSLFGFPYNRNWLEIKKYLVNQVGEYDSSEKNTIGNFYLTNLEFNENAKIYVEVEKPQSFSKAIKSGIQPEKVFENSNGTKSTIYFLK